METTNHRLERLKKAKAQLTARIQKMEAAEKARERKRDTRRKILVGNYYMNKAKEEGTFDALMATMEAHLNRETDRELFRCPPWQDSLLDET